jgi:hypothetical protein
MLVHMQCRVRHVLQRAGVFNTSTVCCVLLIPNMTSDRLPGHAVTSLVWLLCVAPPDICGDAGMFEGSLVYLYITLCSCDWPVLPAHHMHKVPAVC